MSMLSVTDVSAARRTNQSCFTRRREVFARKSMGLFIRRIRIVFLHDMRILVTPVPVARAEASSGAICLRSHLHRIPRPRFVSCRSELYRVRVLHTRHTTRRDIPGCVCMYVHTSLWFITKYDVVGAFLSFFILLRPQERSQTSSTLYVSDHVVYTVTR